MSTVLRDFAWMCFQLQIKSARKLISALCCGLTEMGNPYLNSESSILPHLFEIVGRYDPSHKSFLTRGRSEASFLLNAQLSFPVNPSAHGEGVKLSSPETQSYGEGIKLSLLPKCTAIPHMGKESKPGVKAILFHSGVARAFPGGRAAHPEDQNEEENKENLRKNERTYRKMRKDWGNVPILPTQEWEAGYGPAFPQILPQNAKLSFPTILQILPILYAGKDLSP